MLVENDVTIVAFIDNKLSDSQIDEIKDKISSIDNVSKIEFRSKKNITKEMRESSETFDSIMKNWSDDENPIQNTFQVKVKDINKIKNVADEIKKIDGINLVKYGEGMVEQLVSVFTVVHKICLGAVVALVLVTAFLISNTIKITISSRQREIGIMRLIGASNLNILFPLNSFSAYEIEV